MPYIPIQEAREKDSASKRFLYSLAEAGGRALVELPAKIVGGVIEEGTKQLFGPGGKWRAAFQSDEQVAAEKTQVRQTLEQQRAQTRGLRAGAYLAEEQGAQVRPDAETRRANETIGAMATWKNAQTQQQDALSRAALGAVDANLRAAIAQEEANRYAAEWEYKTRPRPVTGGGGEDELKLLKNLEEANARLRANYGGIIEQVQSDSQLTGDQKAAISAVYNGDTSLFDKLPDATRNKLLLKYPTLSEAQRTYKAFKLETKRRLLKMGRQDLVDTLDGPVPTADEPGGAQIADTTSTRKDDRFINMLGRAATQAREGAVEWLRVSSRQARQVETDYKIATEAVTSAQKALALAQQQLSRARASVLLTGEAKTKAIKDAEATIDEKEAALTTAKQRVSDLAEQRKKLRHPPQSAE